MKILIVESNRARAGIWAAALRRSGARVRAAHGQEEAVALLEAEVFELLILNIVITGGSALALADLAQFRTPDTRIIFVTGSGFFSDGSIFNLCANACACLPATTPPEDLAVMALHYAAQEPATARAG